jgi:hypothetical protein
MTATNAAGLLGSAVLRRASALATLAFLVVLAVSHAKPAAATQFRYTVKVDRALPLVANVYLERVDGAVFGAGAVAAPRGLQFGSVVQIEDVRCDGRRLVESSRASWQLPAHGCRRLQWRSPLLKLQVQGLDASTQPSFFAPLQRFWLISEPASLLRVPQVAAGAALAVRGAPLVGASEQRVPALSQAPEFFVLGRPGTRATTAAGRHVLHVSAVRLDLDQIERFHAPAVAFLAGAMGELAATEPMRIVWLPVDAAAGEAGGAAGHTSFLANVVTRGGAVQSDALALTLYVLFHEQFHQLLRPPLPLPTWLNESLAEYHARRAAEVVGIPPEQRTVLERRYLPLDGTPRHTLLEIQAQLDSGQGEHYGRLYADGSTFWLAVHQAIIAKGDPRGLDAVMPQLLWQPVEGNALPPAWIELLRAAAGPKFDELVQRFVVPRAAVKRAP